MISLDTETTGGDWWHGARPYFVTTCNSEGEQRFWQWDVNPINREVDVLEDDIDEINGLITSEEEIVGQNIKFDVHALSFVGVNRWPWKKTQDTLIAGHLLASNQPHNLTDMAIHYLGIDIEPQEKKLEKATQEARRWCRTHAPEWLIAKKGLPCMPSAKEKTWKIDAWLPRTLRQLEDHGPEEWDTVLEEYANYDSSVTVALWAAMESELKRRDLWEIYLERMKVVPVIWRMEQRGMTGSISRHKELREEYLAEQSSTATIMKNIASSYKVDCEDCSGMLKSCKSCKGTGKVGYKLELPKSGNNGSLLNFIFGVMKLPIVGYTETGNPSLDKEALAKYPAVLAQGSDKLKFIEALTSKKKRDTSLSFIEAYEKFGVPCKAKDYYTLHPSLNQTGTDTLRMSSSNPNSQQVSKLPDDKGYTLRRIFGPLPGREWWAVDYQNIELRIPAFESGEEALMKVFLEPDSPPYYGSYHLAIFHALHPELFEKHGKACKDLFEATWYQWTKNGNFAVLYGAQDETADRAYHVEGAREMIQGRFPKMSELSDRMIAFANKYGYVETIPDKTVNPKRGYPILCTRTERGNVLPTVPLNYHVQSTAMYCTAKAMVRCQEQLDEWNADGFDGHIVIQVHDEIVFDFPAGGKRNLPRIKKLVQLMCQSGEDIGIPLTASAKWCPENWSKHEDPRDERSNLNRKSSVRNA